MDFLNPFILFGLIAAGLPVLIHLLTRAKSRLVPFSSLKFLKELEEKQIRRLKLRQILLLILRTLAILFLILAFARPVLRSSAAGPVSSRAAGSLAIIVDNSFSMQTVDRQSLWTQAVSAAQNVTELVRPGDKVLLLTTADSTAAPAREFRDAESVRAAIGNLEPQFQGTFFNQAVQRARRWLDTSSDVNKELYIFSDFQFSVPADSLLIRDDFRTFAMPLRPEQPQNLSIDAFQLKSAIFEQNKPVETTATLTNHSAQPFENSLIQLFVNRERVAQSSATLAPGESQTLPFRFTLRGSGLHGARLELEDDDLLADNQRYLSFRVPERLRVAIVEQNPEDSRYLKMALRARQAVSDLGVETLPAARLGFTELDFDVIWLMNITELSPQALERLQRFVENGGGLISVLGDRTNIRDFNAGLAETFKLPEIVGSIGSLAETASQFSIRSVDLRHPIFSGMFETTEADFQRPRFRFGLQFRETGDLRTIMSFTNQMPYLLEKQVGEGTLLIYTSAFRLQLSDIPHRTIFAPLVSRSAAYAGLRHTVEHGSSSVGTPISYPLTAAMLKQDLEMQRPDDRFDRLTPSMQPGGAFIEYSQTDIPGLYQLLAEGRAVAQWAVNVSSQEAAYPVWDDTQIEKRLKASVLPRTTNLRQAVLQTRHGTELWPFFVVAALICLLAEMLLYREPKPAASFS